MMDNETTTVFEEIGILLLIDRFPRMESFVIDFLFIQVEGQVFLKEDQREREGDLSIYFRIAANMMPGEVEGFDFQWSMESFFEVHQDLLVSRLQNNGVVFQSSAIQGDGTAQGTSDDAGEEESWAEFFSTNVIIGVSVSMASVLVVGAFIMSRPMWRRRDNGDSMGSPGRLGAAPSYDSEDNADPQSIFLSFSGGSKQGGTSQEMDGGEAGIRSIGSYYTTSTSGSQLVSLSVIEILFVI
jgi:hypothetical protein